MGNRLDARAGAATRWIVEQTFARLSMSLMRTMQVEFTSKEPGRLMTEIPNNSFARDSTVTR